MVSIKTISTCLASKDSLCEASGEIVFMLTAYLCQSCLIFTLSKKWIIFSLVYLFQSIYFYYLLQIVFYLCDEQHVALMHSGQLFIAHSSLFITRKCPHKRKVYLSMMYHLFCIHTWITNLYGSTFQTVLQTLIYVKVSSHDLWCGLHLTGTTQELWSF